MPASTPVAGRTAASSGIATIATITEIDGLPLKHAKMLTLRLATASPFSGGSSPAMDVYVQRALAPNPGASDWEDIAAFPQVTTSNRDDVITLPLERTDSDGTLASQARVRAIDALAASTILTGNFGDQLRIREKIGGTIGTAAVYSVHAIAN